MNATTVREEGSEGWGGVWGGFAWKGGARASISSPGYPHSRGVICWGNGNKTWNVPLFFLKTGGTQIARSTLSPSGDPLPDHVTGSSGKRVSSSLWPHIPRFLSGFPSDSGRPTLRPGIWRGRNMLDSLVVRAASRGGGRNSYWRINRRIPKCRWSKGVQLNTRFKVQLGVARIMVFKIGVTNQRFQVAGGTNTTRQSSDGGGI